MAMKKQSPEAELLLFASLIFVVFGVALIPIFVYYMFIWNPGR